LDAGGLPDDESAVFTSEQVSGGHFQLFIREISSDERGEHFGVGAAARIAHHGVSF
jgi:hypothetical protein